MKDRAISMRVTFDRSVNAAYIFLDQDIAQGGVARTVPVDPIAIGGMVNIDVDEHGRLLGIEILDATNMLPPGLITKINE